MKVYIILAFICFSLASIVLRIYPESYAQTAPSKEFQQVWEAGIPFVTHYTPDDYKAHVQNWCFVQDNKGIIYVGNTSGVLEFDGISWRLINLPNSSPAKSLAKSTDNIIYVGAVRDIGYLQPDSIGQMQYHSLLPRLDTAYHNFVDIWFTYSIGKAAYFISDDYIFKWNNNSFKVWRAEKGFGFAGLVRNQIYIDNKGIGITRLQNDSLILIPDGDRFLHSKRGITTFLPYKDDKILIGHYGDGLFLYDNKRFIPFKNSKDNLLYDKSIYSGAILSNGDFVFLATGHGCFIVDKNYNIKQWLNKKKGLTSDVIIGCYVDREGNLWLATENGINKVEISSPLRIFNQQSGLSEGAERIVYQNKRLYAATKNGIFYLENISENAEKKDSYFKKIDGISHQIWDIISKGKFLLAGNFIGLYQIDPAHHVKELIHENTSDLYPSKIDTNRVYAGTMYGNLYALNFENNQWIAEKSKLSLEGRIMRIDENPEGSLWISTRYNGVYKIDWSPSNISRTFDKNYTLTYYDTSNGLPEISYNVVFQSHSETYFSTQRGIYRFDKKDQKFKQDFELMHQLNNPSSGFENLIKESVNGGMWISVGSNINNSIYKYEKGIVKELVASKRISDFGAYDIYELNNIVFFSGIKGCICYNQQIEKNYNIPFSVNLRKVITNNDSVLFAGHSNKLFFDNEVSLSYTNNYLRFIYVLPSYDKPELNQYQYYLEGFDKGWSAWSTETQRDFTNFSEGDYVFHVRGKNIYGFVSKEAKFAFTIQPPWHRTWWAYLIYIFLGLGLVGLVMQQWSKHLRHEKEELENVVKVRTQQLAEQAEQLKEMNKQKSRFFANISHEFRTPLTLIKGPVEQVLDSHEKSLSIEDKIMIKNNADRLLKLVNQLLDLSKLDANNLQLNDSEGDIFGFLRAIGSAFSSHAEQRKINYQVNVPENKLFTKFDHDKLEKIIYNLLSNAFKFTPDKGEIILNAFYKGKQITIEISDMGIGIPEEQQSFIFDRFYQIDNSSTREQEGAGIGLSLTKDLIDLMKGDIKVDSRLGRGSKFIVTLPVEPSTSYQEGDEVETIEWKRANQILPEVSPDLSVVKEMSTTASVQEEEGDGLPIILIVEDNADMRNFIGKQLTNNYRMLGASNGNEGLKIAKKEIPDLIITDLMMPQMDGLTLCKKIKTDEYTNHIPVIMLTAKAGQEQKIEGLETGADSYLTKPFDRKELLIRVNSLIQQRKQLREKFSREIILHPRNISITSVDVQFLKKVEDIIEQSLEDDQFGITQMQNALVMSRVQLYRKMKALTDQAPSEFLRNYRLKRAAQILLQKGDNVTQAAYAVGFSNLSYFAKCFKELFGVTPSDYISKTHS